MYLQKKQGGRGGVETTTPGALGFEMEVQCRKLKTSERLQQWTDVLKQKSP